MDIYIYTKYFEKRIENIVLSSNLVIDFSPKIKNTRMKPLKTSDKIRLANSDQNIIETNIFEFNLIIFIENLIKFYNKKNEKEYLFYLYTIIQMKKSTVVHCNNFIVAFVDVIIDTFNKSDNNLCKKIYNNIYHVIEKNAYILKYEDITLYSH